MRHSAGYRLPAAALLLAAMPACAQPRSASQPPPPADPAPFALCEAAISAAERAQHIPDHLLPAMGRVESGRPDPRTGATRPWPWTINVGGEGRFFDTKAAAVAAVQALQAKGVRSIDVGCMQVNLLHHPDAFSSLDEAFDPAANAAYAARFLAGLRRQGGSWPVAVAWYHSQTADRAEDYQRRVYGKLVEHVPGAAPEGKRPATVYGIWPPPGVAFAAFPPTSYAFRAFGASGAAAAPAGAGRRGGGRVAVEMDQYFLSALPATDAAVAR